MSKTIKISMTAEVSDELTSEELKKHVDRAVDTVLNEGTVPEIFSVYNVKTSEYAERGKALGDELLLFVNSYGNVGAADFVQTICNAHRTLQQSTMRLFIETISALANNNYDLRNENTVKLAKAISKIS